MHAPEPEAAHSRNDLQLLDEAIDLMMRHQAGTGQDTARLIRLWRGQSPRHEHIWQRVSEADGISALALSPQPRAPSRRRILTGGGVALGLAALAATGAPWLQLQLRADHITGKASILPLGLPDGSRITLGPDSAVIAPTQATPREAVLLRGMAWIDIAQDSRTPFALHVDGRTIRSSGAAFEVSSEAGAINMAVARQDAELSGHRIGAGKWLRLHHDTDRVETGLRDPDLAGAWRNHMLVADAEPLNSLVTRIARWVPARVIMAGGQIGNHRVSGLFDLSQPEAALAAAIRPAGGVLRELPGAVVVTRSRSL